jgi:hypothetical protein
MVDPVTSALLLLAKGLSLKRADSPLQPAIPVVSANTAMRDKGRRTHRTIEAIATHSYALPSSSLTPSE